MNRVYPFDAMKNTLTLLGLIFLATSPAYAGQSEAREVARMNNCTPKKIEVYDSQLGNEGKTIYQVTCTLPKIANKDAAQNAPDTLLISCDQSLCEMIRPLTPEKK